MSLTVKDCAELNLGIYGSLPTEITWDFYDDGTADDGVVWGIKIVNGIVVPTFRGSLVLMDWLRDIMAMATPWKPAGGLGPVHPGFYLGMVQVWDELKDKLAALNVPASRVVPNGHSLGAGRARDLTGLMMLDGAQPGALVRFGSPKPGFQQLVDLCKPVQQWSYRNISTDSRHHDNVTGVPFNLPVQEYVDEEPIDQAVTPLAHDYLSFFRFHHMQLYAGAAPDQIVIP